MGAAGLDACASTTPHITTSAPATKRAVIGSPRKICPSSAVKSGYKLLKTATREAGKWPSAQYQSK